MQYLCMRQQSENQDLFKGHEPASPGLAYELSYGRGISRNGA